MALGAIHFLNWFYSFSLKNLPLICFCKFFYHKKFVWKIQVNPTWLETWLTHNWIDPFENDQFLTCKLINSTRPTICYKLVLVGFVPNPKLTWFYWVVEQWTYCRSIISMGQIESNFPWVNLISVKTEWTLVDKCLLMRSIDLHRIWTKIVQSSLNLDGYREISIGFMLI